VDGFLALIEANVTGAWEAAVDALGVVPKDLLEPAAAYKLARMAQLQPASRDRVVALLTNWEQTQATGIGRAAKSALDTLVAGGGNQ
jgi:hypothetical protein